MAPKFNFILIIGIIAYSTFCYHFPLFMHDLDAVDFEEIPKDFYSFYCMFLAFSFSLIFIYAIACFLSVPSRNYKTKILALWLVIAELSTLIDFVLRKYFLVIHHSSLQMLMTSIVFLFCCLFFLHRAISKSRSDKFDQNKTYVLNYLPRNIFGIISWIVKHEGHKGIYQADRIYRFKSRTGKVEESIFYPGLFKKNVTFKEIPKIKDIEKIVGREYHLLRYNCSTMVRDATRN